MRRGKQILIRVSDEQHRVLAAKARVASVSIPSLIRGRLDGVTAAESRRYLRLEQLLLARMGIQLELVAEQCRSLENKAAALEIITRLVGIERELHGWKERSGK